MYVRIRLYYYDDQPKRPYLYLVPTYTFLERDIVYFQSVAYGHPPQIELHLPPLSMFRILTMIRCLEEESSMSGFDYDWTLLAK